MRDIKILIEQFNQILICFELDFLAILGLFQIEGKTRKEFWFMGLVGLRELLVEMPSLLCVCDEVFVSIRLGAKVTPFVCGKSYLRLLENPFFCSNLVR